MRGLNLDQLRTFAAVVDQKSFSGAAARLGVTQPAVSLQVRQLEKRFGVKLIERVGRRAAATAAGAELLTHARDVEAALAAAADAMAPHAKGVAGRVRLGTGATACIYLLPKVLRDLRQRFPALDIVVSTGEGSTSFEASFDGWTPGQPSDSAANGNDFIRTTAAGFPEAAVVTTPDTVYMGFGFEGITDAAVRATVMDRVMGYLLGS